jgi:nicotinamide-nucleotide amidase
VSGEVAEAMADGVRRALGATIGIGVTGVAGPGGGTDEKPVGTVGFCVSDADGRLTRRALLPGNRSDIRDRATTVALHLLRRLLLDERDDPAAQATA